MSVQRLSFITVLGGVLSWAGLGYLTYACAPTTLTCIIFLVLLLPAAFTPLTLLAYYLHRRFARPGNEQRKFRDAMREGGLLAGLLVAWAGLRMVEALNWITMLVMLGVVVVLEIRQLMERK
mgnify:CR=1 FL=1